MTINLGTYESAKTGLKVGKDLTNAHSGAYCLGEKVILRKHID